MYKRPGQALALPRRMANRTSQPSENAVQIIKSTIHKKCIDRLYTLCNNRAWLRNLEFEDEGCIMEPEPEGQKARSRLRNLDGCWAICPLLPPFVTVNY